MEGRVHRRQPAAQVRGAIERKNHAKHQRRACRLLLCRDGGCLSGRRPRGPGGDRRLPGWGRHLHGRPAGMAGDRGRLQRACALHRLGGYDGGNGNPPGSFAANTTISLNLLTLFKSTVTLQSPDFTVSRDGDATLHLDRQFAAGSLVDLAPELTYDVALLDRTADDKSTADRRDARRRARLHRQRPRGHGQSRATPTRSRSRPRPAPRWPAPACSPAPPAPASTTSRSPCRRRARAAGKATAARGSNLTDSRLASPIQGGGLIGPAVLKGNKALRQGALPEAGRPHLQDRPDRAC